MKYKRVSSDFKGDKLLLLNAFLKIFTVLGENWVPSHTHKNHDVTAIKTPYKHM
jgi:hypothetical protein